MRKLTFLLFICATLLLSNCASDTTPSSVFGELEKAVESDASIDNVNKLLGAYNAFISENATNSTQILPVFEKAYDLTVKHRPKASAVYLMGLIRESDASNANVADWLYELGNSLKSQGKVEASNVLYSNLLERFPNYAKAEELKSATAGIQATDVIATLAEARLQNPDQFGINTAASFKYVDACEAFALSNPSHPQAPEYLFDAAEMAKLLKTNNKALAIYDWLIQKYPNYKKTPSALFIKAFILENELNNIDLAREAYQLFLEKYPDNDFADDAKFSLDNLGKSPDEVLKAIEANAK